MSIQVHRDLQGQRELIGQLEYDPLEGGTFTYDAAFLARNKSAQLGISEQLPLSDAPYTAPEYSAFFQGLLPEGEVLGNLAQLYQLPRSNYLGMLEQMGCECIGALTFVAKNQSPEEYEPRYEPVEAELISDMQRDPARMATLVAANTRLSLAGAQSKVAWLLPQGANPAQANTQDWQIPRGTAPSTHIIKISRRGEEEIASNELVCSLLAQACGIDCANVCALPEVPGAIAVERYDRVFAGEEPLPWRLHQEDFCQALGLAPFYKYQPSGIQANYPVMAAELIERCSSNPAADLLEFSKRLLFCYVVGNSDAHLKNFSLLYNTNWTGRRLAPLYDITCIPLTGYSTNMPFDIGEHRKLDEIDARDLYLLACDLGCSLDSLSREVHTLLDAFESPALTLEAAEQEVLERILSNAASRLKTLQQSLG